MSVIAELIEYRQIDYQLFTLVFNLIQCKHILNFPYEIVNFFYNQKGFNQCCIDQFEILKQKHQFFNIFDPLDFAISDSLGIGKILKNRFRYFRFKAFAANILIHN